MQPVYKTFESRQARKVGHFDCIERLGQGVHYFESLETSISTLWRCHSPDGSCSAGHGTAQRQRVLMDTRQSGFRLQISSCPAWKRVSAGSHERQTSRAPYGRMRGLASRSLFHFKRWVQVDGEWQHWLSSQPQWGNQAGGNDVLPLWAEGKRDPAVLALSLVHDLAQTSWTEEWEGSTGVWRPLKMGRWREQICFTGSALCNAAMCLYMQLICKQQFSLTGHILMNALGLIFLLLLPC